MNRSLVASIALSLALAVAMAPAVLAADPAPTEITAAITAAPSLGATPSDAAPSDPAPGASPSVAPPDDGTPPDGVISVDPTFITEAPNGAVLGATGRPAPTLPPTDTIQPATEVGGATLEALLAALTALSVLLLVAGRPPTARHRLK